MRVTNLRNESSAVDQIVLNADGSFGGELGSTLGSKLDLAGGKILQIVRATDSTQRTTTSTSFVDVTGMSVTITPQKNDSAIIILACYLGIGSTTTGQVMNTQITDASNNAISGTETVRLGASNASFVNAYQTLVARDTPATINATTYKLRFSAPAGGTVELSNNLATGQMYAIEVSA
jgi:hypothetical protein